MRFACLTWSIMLSRPAVIRTWRGRVSSSGRLSVMFTVLDGWIASSSPRTTWWCSSARASMTGPAAGSAGSTLLLVLTSGTRPLPNGWWPGASPNAGRSATTSQCCCNLVRFVHRGRPYNPVLTLGGSRSRAWRLGRSVGSDADRPFSGWTYLPAEVRRRYITRSTDGPLESATIRCPAGHWFNGPIEYLTRESSDKHPQGLAGAAASATPDSLASAHNSRRNSGGCRIGAPPTSTSGWTGWSAETGGCARILA